MKKILALLLVLALSLALAACGQATAATETALPAETAAPAETAPAAPGPEHPDVDLTLLSGTMVYAEVYAMMLNPADYIGKTVKMRGQFNAWTGEAGQVWFTCIVQDATACCAQGLEFELRESRRFPEEYPAPGSEITVFGTFDTYEEEVDGNIYFYMVLRDAELL